MTSYQLLSCTQGFGAVAVLNLAVMSGNIAGVSCDWLAKGNLY